MAKGITTFNTETNKFEEFPNPVTADAHGGSFVRRVPIDADLLDGRAPEYYKDIAIVCDDTDTFSDVKALYEAGKTILLSTEADKNGPFLHLLMFDEENQAFYFSAVVGDTSTATVSLTASGWQSTRNSFMKALAAGRSDILKLDGNGQPTYAVPNVDYVTPGNGVPEGAIIMWSGNVIPEGWALCNGLNGTPDLRDKFIVGAGGSYNIGATGGSDEVTLDVGNLPSHKHNNTVSFDASELTMESAGGHSHNVLVDVAGGQQAVLVNQQADQGTNKPGLNRGSGGYNLITGSAGSHKHTFSIDGDPVSITNANTGSGTAHENRPPYYALAFIMKTYSN